MKTNRILSAALIVFAATACNTDYTTENFSGQDLEPMKIAGVETKTVFNPTETGGTVNWTVGDRLAIFDNLGGKNIFNNSEGAAASFSGNVTAGTTMFRGIYPAELATSASTTNGILTATLPATQTPAAGTFAEELNISVTTGFKTPGTPEVTDISFHNVCGLISFTVPQRIAAKKVTFSTESRELAGTLEIDCDNCTASITGNGSKSVSMEGNFAAGSTFYFVVTPGTITGYRIDVETNAGSLYYKSTATGTLDIKAGDLKKLGTIDFKNGEMSASASHTYSGSTLTGSSLTVSHGIPQNMWKDVTALNVTVSKDGTTFRSFSTTSLDAATVVPEGNTYLPQGDYTVSCSYTMNGVTTTSTKTVNPGKPNFTGSASVSGVTSYSKYLNRSLGDPNAHNAETITDISASCPAIANISAAVLNEVPVSYTIAIDDAAHKTGTINNPSTTTVAADNKTGAAWGERTLKATFTFDGVAINGSSNCLITGLPYRAPSEIAFNASGKSWTKVNGNRTSVNSTSLVLKSGVGDVVGQEPEVKSPDFHIPSNIQTKVSIDCNIHSQKFGLWYTTKLTAKVNGTTIISQTSGESKDNNYSLSNSSATFTTSGKNIVLETNVTAVEARYADITKVHVEYQD